MNRSMGARSFSIILVNGSTPVLTTEIEIYRHVLASSIARIKKHKPRRYRISKTSSKPSRDSCFPHKNTLTSFAERLSAIPKRPTLQTCIYNVQSAISTLEIREGTQESNYIQPKNR